MSSWPINPYTKIPMHPGKEPGDYQYTLSEDGKRFTLDFYGEDGKVVWSMD